MFIDRVEVIRGGRHGFYHTMPNGDRLDSVVQLYSGPSLVTTNENVNTDPTKSWMDKGGIVAESVMQKAQLRYICDRREDNGKKVLFIYQATNARNNCIVTARDLTEEDLTLVSLIPNPAHGGKFIITHVLFHSIGVTWDGSHGCFSSDGFSALISYFELGNKGIFNLTRDPAWLPPDCYLSPGGQP